MKGPEGQGSGVLSKQRSLSGQSPQDIRHEAGGVGVGVRMWWALFWKS